VRWYSHSIPNYRFRHLRIHDAFPSGWVSFAFHGPLLAVVALVVLALIARTPGRLAPAAPQVC